MLDVVKHNMKKIYLGLLFVAVLGLVVPTLVIANEPETNNQAAEDDLLELVNEAEDEQIQSTNPTTTSTGKGLKAIGKWGHGKDEEADGFFGARITRKGRFAVFKGVYNLTGEEERNQIVGIMKKGYFNGKIITNEGSVKLTGLYKVDKENRLLKMQWMSPGHAGWAIARVSCVEE